MNDVRPPAPIDRHGVSHMKYMHARRRESAMKNRFKTAVGDQISKHVVPRLDNYNKRRAIRTSDLISLELRSGPGRELHTRVSGRGQYRRWTPATVLRTSFGRGWKALTRRRVQKNKPSITSARAPRNVTRKHARRQRRQIFSKLLTITSLTTDVQLH